MIDNFKENATISEVGHEVVNVDFLDTLGVNPVFEDSDLSGFVSFWLGRYLDDWLFGQDKTVPFIEDLGEQDSIESWISAQDILGLDWSFDTVLIAHLDDWSRSFLGRLVPVSFFPVVANILQDMAISITISQILSKIRNFSVPAVFADVIVNPSE